MAETKLAYRPDIDGLRAVAILSVVLYHAGIPGFSGGFVGVDVFFVISGFLITSYLAKEIDRTGTVSFSDFYARRMRRLLPALLAVMVVTIFVWLFFFAGASDPERFARSARWSLMGMANVYFKRNTGGYFDGSSVEMPLLHLWSLSVEEQFYLVWPWLLLLGVRVRKLGPLLLVVSAASLFWAQYLLYSHQTTAAFYSTLGRAWELGLGGLVAIILRGGVPKVGRASTKRTLLATVAVGAIVGAVSFYSDHTPFPGLRAVPPVLATAYLIGLGAVSPNLLVFCVLRNPVFVRIGLLSYAWYLWHWPLLAFAQISASGSKIGLGLKIGILLFALLLSEISLRWIERPFRKGKRWVKQPSWKMIGCGVAAIGILLAITPLIPRMERAILAHLYGPAILEQVTEKMPYGEGCMDETGIGTSRCDYDFSRPGESLGEPSRIAIWGDSHACSYFPLATTLAKERGMYASLYCNGGMPPLLAAPVDFASPPPPGAFVEKVLFDLKKKAKQGPISILLTARWMLYSGRPSLSHTTKPKFLDAAQTESGSLSELERRLALTIRLLHDNGVGRVAILLPYPDFPLPIFRCLHREGMSGRCGVARKELEDYRAPVVTAIRSAAKASGAQVFDPVPSLCKADFCPQISDGMVLTVDDNHPTIRAASQLAKPFARTVGGDFFQ